jgi:hypothetical protein
MWHWEDPSWDDRKVEAAVDAAIAGGRVVPPHWRWPTPGPYNGSSGEERIAGWKKVWGAVKMGLIPAPTVCSLCSSKATVQYHNEDYRRPLNAKPICSSCHRILHRRFKDPQPWLQLVARTQRPGCWFSELAMEERSAYGADFISVEVAVERSHTGRIGPVRTTSKEIRPARLRSRKPTAT